MAVRRVLHSTDQVTKIMLAHSRTGQLLRDRVVLPLLRSKAMQKRITRKLSQLDFTYDGLSLSAHHTPAGRVLVTRPALGGTMVQTEQAPPTISVFPPRSAAPDPPEGETRQWWPTSSAGSSRAS